jgi:putative thioredoxin
MSQTPENPHVIEATVENFQREVIERSYEVPVVVDFWAAWCAPCRALGPVLERLATEYAGKFVLVKADTELLPEIAGGFGVRSIPAVFGLRDGQAVDGFLGAQPEAVVREWLDRLMPSPAEQIAAEARRLEPDDPKAAEARYRAALDLEPDSPTTLLGLARVSVRQGRFDEARTLIRTLEGRGYFDPQVDSVKAELELQAQATGTGGVAAARAALAARPDDPALRLELAETLAASGQHEEALELALALVEEHRKDVSESARQLMVNVFHVLPPESELVSEFRRRLSLALY